MADNKYYIEKYQDFDKIIKTYFQAKEKLEDVIDNGDLSQLLDATIETGKANKK